MATAQFESIYHGLGPAAGKLRIAPSGLGWKSSDENEAVVTVPGSDIKFISWIRVARNYQMRIGTHKSRTTFDGFVREDFERLSNLCKQYYNITIETKDISVRGWNWGVAEVQSDDLAFLVAGKPAFTVPLSQVSNTSIQKAEVALEFSSALPPPPADGQEDPIARKKRLRALPDEISEMRLYLPGSARGMKKKGDKAKAKAEGVKDGEESSEGESEEEDEDGDAAAQVFHDAVKEKAAIGQVVGESFCTIPDILCVTPRGRFDIDLYPDFMRLRGKTYDYRVTYPQIQRLFLLPKPDDIHSQLVVNIDPPIRQGQTRYPYLVMQFAKDEIMELELSLDEETIRDKYEGNLKQKYDDPAYEVVSLMFRVLTQKKVITPGNFQSHDGQAAVKCNLKANEGQLYFLEKQLLFIAKVPQLASFNEISAVVLARVGGALPSARTFDLSIRLKDSSTLLFSALNKEELPAITDFLTMKKIKVKNEMEELAAAEAEALGAESSEDEAMSVDGDSEDEGKKRKGRVGGGAVGGGELREEDDEDSEVDEDFQASGSEDSGGSGSSDDDDSDASDAMSEDDDDGGKAKKPAKKKQKTK